MSDNSSRIYTCEQGAERLGNDVVKASTLARLARLGLVPHTRNGRKVGWTDAQLAGVVDYLSTQTDPAPDTRPEPQQSIRKPRTTPPLDPAPTSIRPLTTKRGSRYAAT
ncbi:hypothetical protein OIE66_40670 [Nonomuraea sp. NBC_01738]|uniref:hypothetical protein n=1 Tax=Nonomuraea sp. NBC_01738 TaxID=2976003 RepID=UPI002E0FD9BB|nr:hypothetical protein OIE66_40670 [Nonomuraea sp. NBC_01738]